MPVAGDAKRNLGREREQHYSSMVESFGREFDRNGRASLWRELGLVNQRDGDGYRWTLTSLVNQKLERSGLGELPEEWSVHNLRMEGADGACGVNLKALR